MSVRGGEIAAAEVGDLVTVEYRLQSGNYRWFNWRMTAIYMGTDKQKNYAMFSLRPKAGDTKIRVAHLTSLKVEEGAKAVQAKYKFGARAADLPVKLPNRLGRARKPSDED